MKRNVLVGVFVIAALALFTLGLFFIGDKSKAFSKNMDLYTEFSNISGLMKGAKVQVSGMDAGQVLEIAVPSSPTGKFRIKLRIQKQLNGLVRTDSVASIATQGVVGDTILAIKTGSARSPEAAQDSTLPSKEPFDFAALLDRGDGLLKDVDGTVKHVDSTIQTLGPKLNDTVDQANTSIGNVNDIVVGLKQGRGAAGMLLRDQALADQVRQTVGNAQQATVSLNHASGQADNMISDLQSRHLPQQVDDTMAHVKSATTNLDATSQKLNQTITEMTGPDQQGVDAGTNLRESLSNLNETTANMADDTEALKRNFFFKGFFHHRGYYNLSELSPAKYRSDKLFTQPADSRTWLPTNELFVTQQDGTETLSNEGRKALDNAVAQAGVSILDRPIVIEGYSTASDPGQQIALAHRRSMLVRQYLQAHFSLDQRNIGSVALGNTPPANVNKTDVDGVCVVVLRAAK